MSPESPPGAPSRPERTSPTRYPGPRVVFVGALIIAALTAFVVWRIVVSSGPGPNPDTIPKRPHAAARDSS
jgi:hypothetical protein